MNGDEAARKPILGYRTLRQISEWASGIRGSRPVWFVVSPGRTPVDPVIKTYLVDPEGVLSKEELAVSVIIPTHVGHGSGNRESIQYARIGPRPDGGGSVDLLDPDEFLHADAAFWTQSSIEKFLVPYYASVAGSDAAERVEAVLRLLGSPRRPPAPGVEADEPVVYALIHLPQSEYTDVSEAARAEARTRGLPLDLSVAFTRGAETGVLHIVDFFERFSDYLGPATDPGRAGRGAGTA